MLVHIFRNADWAASEAEEFISCLNEKLFRIWTSSESYWITKCKANFLRGHKLENYHSLKHLKTIFYLHFAS